jgi:UDP-N-acetylmuramate--alanine ligase
MDTPHFRSAKQIHFVGIKGVGMTALALCAQDLHIQVTGSDTDQVFVTQDVLVQRHLDTVTPIESPDVPDGTDLVIYTGAHDGVNHPQVQTAKAKNIRAISHAEAVGEAMEGKIGISICGVGGKTSTAAMMANILEYANLQPSFIIGVGKVLNLQVPGQMSSGEHVVVEADEYAVSPGTDNSPRFRYQHPKIIVCTNIAFDHPDVYESVDATKKAFSDFFNNLDETGIIIANGDSEIMRQINPSQKTIYFGESAQNDWYVKDSFIGQGKQLVTVGHQDETFNLMLSVPGRFNARNALAAYLAAKELGIEHQTIIEGLQLYRGSKRRFEKIAENRDILYYDDYAHHPSEINQTLMAAKEWLPLFRLTVVFQPHTYTRTKMLLDEFSVSFNHADEVIITDIYGARESNDPSISGYTLAEAIKKHHDNVKYIPQSDLVNHINANKQPYDAIFTMGAGDIYLIHKDIQS